ncbi:riboflavin synthase subunit alpha [Corallincola platygyrae]|uniref:Riboflavin synthase n=1 Tax=Corallincola platygyrae TaxID=1193278 RepID=A0ABW4XLW9_9GAMM
MFTGIVQCSATVIWLDSENDIARLRIEVPAASYLERVEVGASIAINGVCLTVVDFDKTVVDFDVIAETLRRTNIGALKKGEQVNFERAAKWGDEIGGHMLSGHIQTQGNVEAFETRGNEVDIQIHIDAAWRKYVMEKGYVSIDGISLTIGKVEEQSFWLHLIPETLRVTTLGARKVGELVNIEIDTQTQAIVDTVERVLASR